MLRIRGRALPVLLAAVVLVGGANLAAYAANGHPLLLGQANTESQPTSVSNTGRGPALSLHTGAKSAPLAVNSSKVVKHLNADRVDGLHGGDTTAFTYQLPQVVDVSTFTQAFPGLPRGRQYVASYWLQVGIDGNPDGIVCELDTNTLSGDPGGETVAVSASISSSIQVTAGATGFVSTHNRAVTLTCGTDSGDVNIAGVTGQVTFVPVGRAHVAAATTLP